jgi:hypothetical protein
VGVESIFVVMINPIMRVARLSYILVGFKEKNQAPNELLEPHQIAAMTPIENLSNKVYRFLVLVIWVFLRAMIV